MSCFFRTLQGNGPFAFKLEQCPVLRYRDFRNEQGKLMKARSPALTQSSLVSTAGRKTRKVQQKLNEAEAELDAANEVLAEAVPAHDKESIDAALEQSAAAKEKVHDAAEELEVVNTLLSDPDHAPQPAKQPPSSEGNTGQGVKSLIPHLKRKSSAPK